MHKILQAIKNFLSKLTFQKKLIIVLVLSFIFSITYFQASFLRGGDDNKESLYKKSSVVDLSKITQSDLNKVSHFYIYETKSESSHELFSRYRDIFIKNKDEKNPIVFTKVSAEAYQSFYGLTLEPYLKENKKFNIGYVSELKGIGALLGVSEDPKEIMAENQAKSIFSVLGGWFGQIFFLILILLLILYLNKVRTTSDAIDVINPKSIKDSLDDLVGLEEPIAEILQLEDMILNKDLYDSFNIKKKTNIMLTGPAGVGKTKIARCLAKRLDMPLFYMSAANLQSGYVGGGAKTLRKLVKEASEHKNAIIFIDEAESILQNRSSGAQHWEKETINALLAILDGANATQSGLIWLVATNMDEHKTQMDEAMMRRFPLKINFRLPNFEERKEILSRLLLKIDTKSLENDIDLTHIAGVTNGLSPALLENLVNRASLSAIKQQKKINQEMLLNSFEREVVGLTDRKTTENMDKCRKLIARHEAGHFILNLHCLLQDHGGDLTQVKSNIDVIKISTESVSKVGALGYVLSKEGDKKLQTRSEYEAEIMQLYAGMVNEELYYNLAGVTAGAHNDIEKVSHLLKIMITQVGFYQDHKLNYSILQKDMEITGKQLALIEELSEKFYKRTQKVLSDYMGLTDILVDELMMNYILSIDDAMDLVAEFFSNNEDLMQIYQMERKAPSFTLGI